MNGMLFMCCEKSDSKKRRAATGTCCGLPAETFPFGPLQVDDSAQEESEAPDWQSCSCRGPQFSAWFLLCLVSLLETPIHPGPQNLSEYILAVLHSHSRTVCQASSFVSARETHSARIWGLMGTSLRLGFGETSSRGSEPKDSRRFGDTESLEGPATIRDGNMASGLLFSFISLDRRLNGVDTSPSKSLVLINADIRNACATAGFMHAFQDTQP